MRQLRRAMSVALAGTLVALPPSLGIEVAVSTALVAPLFLMGIRDGSTAGTAAAPHRASEKLKRRGETDAPPCVRAARADADHAIFAQTRLYAPALCTGAQIYV